MRRSFAVAPFVSDVASYFSVNVAGVANFVPLGPISNARAAPAGGDAIASMVNATSLASAPAGIVRVAPWSGVESVPPAAPIVCAAGAPPDEEDPDEVLDVLLLVQARSVKTKTWTNPGRMKRMVRRYHARAQ
jgi:hypothetical protein